MHSSPSERGTRPQGVNSSRQEGYAWIGGQCAGRPRPSLPGISPAGRRRRGRPHARGDHACHAQVGRTVQPCASRSLTASATRQWRDEASLPGRRPTHSAKSVGPGAPAQAYVPNIGKGHPRSPIMPRLMPTAKTTMLLANSSPHQRRLERIRISLGRSRTKRSSWRVLAVGRCRQVCR
jgi:hypothetical protein